MTRDEFVRLVEQALDGLPARFAKRLKNIAVVVEDYPPADRPGPRQGLLLGQFHGVPATRKSVWDVLETPSRIVLYQKNIEAICATEEEIREQVRLTVLHELGHYFGMSEEQLRNV